MNKFTCSILAAVLSLSTYSVLAATTESNTDDASALGTSETPQLIQQNRRTVDRGSRHTRMSNRDCMHKMKMNIKMMDTDNDGMISRDEFMTFHEKKFDNMKQTDGMVNMNDMHAGMCGKRN